MLTDQSSHIETDKESQKEIVQLYNDWYNHIKFSSHIDNENQYWLKLKDYCINHKKIFVEFFFDLCGWLKTSGHFLMMMDEVWPGVVKVDGYMPQKIMENIWKDLLKKMEIRGELE